MTAPAAPPASRWSVLIPFAIVTLIWGSTWLVIRDQLGAVPPSWSITYRFLTAGIVMLAYARFRGETLRLDARGWGFVTLVGLMQFCLNFHFVYGAEQLITSGLVAVVFALLLLPNALMGWLFLGQRLSRQLLAGSAIAMIGVALLFANEARTDPHGPAQSLAGIGITLLGVLSASVANVLQGTATARRYPLIPALGTAMLIGAAIDGGFAWANHGPPVFDSRPAYIAGVAYLGIVASALAFPLYFGVLRQIGAAKAAYSSVLVPVIAMALSTIFEGYRWSVLGAAGAALAMAGLVIALIERRPAR